MMKVKVFEIAYFLVKGYMYQVIKLPFYSTIQFRYIETYSNTYICTLLILAYFYTIQEIFKCCEESIDIVNHRV